MPTYTDAPPRAGFPRVLFALGLIVLGVFIGQGIIGRIESARAAAAQTPREVTPRGPLPANEQSTIDLFRSTSPSVVYITTLQRMQNRMTLDVTDVPNGTGSGFIWDDVGHVVTNFHVINERNAKYTVTLSDQTTYPATLVGIAPNNDLSVLKIDAPREKLKPLAVGSSNDLQVGQWVMAIGNPFGLDHTLTTGIVSALGRTILSPNNLPIEDVIQTDAAINPGNSGGPLLDSSGRLIGVNAQIANPGAANTGGVGGNVGIGFAIPVDAVNRIVPSIIKNYKEGKLSMPTRAVLGVRLATPQLNADISNRLGVKGVLVVGVDETSGAAKAGLKGVVRTEEGIDFNDVIIEVAGRKVSSPQEIMVALGRFDPDQEVDVKLWNKGAERAAKVKLGSAE
jgi:S1-C subfamily serine protease